MGRELIYLPVERYNSRWTEYVSGRFGMFAYGVRHHEPKVELNVLAPDNTLREISEGVIVDYVARAKFSFAQVQMLMNWIASGQITDDSVIYFEDMWTGGMEMLPYACTLKGIRPKVYAFCHAQSVDPNDFTVKMLPWIRHFEVGWASWLTGIFVADPTLKVMMFEASMCPAEKIHVTGTVFARNILGTLVSSIAAAPVKRFQTVLFTSRLDQEKCPDFFFALADYAKSKGCKAEFKIISGRKVSLEYKAGAKALGIGVIEKVSKAQYLDWLNHSAVMVNAAKQDFIGYCQLDALALGCAPLCPRYLSFPGLLQNDDRYLYEPGNVEDAYNKLVSLLEMQAGEYTITLSSPVPEMYQRFGSKYELSVSRMLEVMYAAD